ncbi:hypothetical protein ACFSSB_11955 [Lacinutrix gracilariae]|uniref:Uncharacterized protein n=1 Tax=Lacinutrix gracilariae TaxID=1747198 RepID=A0ABW5K538_9FLAO
MKLKSTNYQNVPFVFRSVFVLLFCVLSVGYSYAQVHSKENYSNAFIEKCIVEVYQDAADELVFNSKSKKLQVITYFFQKRYEVKYMPEYRGKEFDLLSSVPLNNKYNKQLKIDAYYKPDSFNPLKYQLPLTPRETKIYRIGGTDYLIFIHGKNKGL